MRNLFLFCSASLLLSSCFFNNETKEEALFRKKIESLNMESFNLPDSIDTKLMVATCHDPENNSEIIFVYKDSTKTSVQKIDFFADSTCKMEDLEFLKLNEFRSKHQNVDYVITDKMINIIHVNNHCGALVPNSRNLRRSDRD